MATDRDPEFSSSDLSPTDHVLTELQLHGHRPVQDEPEPRPLPEAKTIAGAVADIFDAMVATLCDTQLEADLENLLWSTVNLFHRAADRVQRALDDNEVAQKRSQKEQDGSEIRSVELERLITEGLSLIERRNTMEVFRDHAADQFERHAGSSWRPRSSSMVNHRTMTAAMIDSRDFLAAKRRVETEVLLPAGAKIAFTGGLDFNDHQLIWDTLDKVRAKHADMVLLHGGSPKGAERIAACWANNRKVPQIAFKPDWARYAKAAPFKRNDQIIDVLPIGVIVFPGSGISANLADKAMKLGIPVWKFSGA
jgi:YspA, cpYpsA-related SLOG family